MKKKISLRKFRKLIYIVIGVLISILIYTSVFPIHISIEKNTIQSAIDKKLPIIKEKNITLPLIKKKISYIVKSDKVKVEFINNSIKIVGNGIISSVKNPTKFSHFNFNIFGVPSYDNKKQQFYFKPDLSKSSINFNKKEVLNLVIPSFISKKLLSNKVKDKIFDLIVKNSLKLANVFFKHFPIYDLKKSKHDTIGLFLKDIKIENNKIILSLTSIELLKHSIGIVLLIILLIGFIIIVTYKVEKKEKFCFFDIFEVVLEVGIDGLSATGEAVGTALEGTGEILGGLS
jgi:hypothetical protein